MNLLTRLAALQAFEVKTAVSLSKALVHRDGSDEFVYGIKIEAARREKLDACLRDCVEALEGLKDYADNIQKNHPDACAHGSGESFLGQLASQVSTDGYYALAALEACVSEMERK